MRSLPNSTCCYVLGQIHWALVYCCIVWYHPWFLAPRYHRLRCVSPPCKHINNKKTSYEDFKLPGFQSKYLCPEHAEQNVAWPSWKHIRKHVLPKAKLCLICWDFLCTNVESFVQRMIYPLNHFLPESEQIDRISPCPHIPIKSTQLPWWPTWYLPKKNCT